MKQKKLPYLLTCMATALSSQAWGAGFQINEHSAAGLGRAFAGEAAIADNAAIAVRNPAAMVLIEKQQISAGISLIQPDASVDLKESSINPSGTPVPTGGEQYSNVIPDAVVPNLHFVKPLNEPMTIGVSLFSNFGLASEYPEDAIAGPIAGKSELTTINLNTNLGYRLNPAWSLGFGLNLIHADATLIRRAGSLQPVLSGAGLNVPSSRTEISYMSGDGWGFGWNAGVLWEINDHHRLGMSYRAAVDVDLKGDYRGTSVPTSLVTGNTVSGELTLSLPDIFEFSGHHQLNPQWTVSYSAMYTGWNAFKELRGTSAECTSSDGAGVCLLKENTGKMFGVLLWGLAMPSMKHGYYAQDLRLIKALCLMNIVH